MHLYRFTNHYGTMFEVEGTSPEEAYKDLCDKGNMQHLAFNTNDSTILEPAVKRGFSLLFPEEEYSPMYKQII